MKALQIVGYDEPLAVTHRPLPDPRHGEVTVRIEAAGICRSDVHYRSGTRPVPKLPLVPGHEIAGTIAAAGRGAGDLEVGDRVALHYLVTCGGCRHCRRGAEQFCEVGQMLGLDRQGGYAEAITVPARNSHRIPDGVSTAAAAVMMCSTVTSLHALRRGRVEPGTSVAIIGAGGLGLSAVQLARVLGADPVLAIDVDTERLALASDLGATAIDGTVDPVQVVVEASEGGVDVAIELVGSSDLMRKAMAMLRPGGRAVAVGITDSEFGLDPYRDLVKREVEILGTADHLAPEVDEVLDMAWRGTIDVDRLITGTVPLEADAVNAALDRLERFGPGVRTVIEQ